MFSNIFLDRNMIINFLGDSITEGYLATKYENSFVPLVGKLLSCKVNQYGIAGSRFARQQYPSIDPKYDLYFASRVDEIDPEADITFIFGGTNDYGHGDAPIGKMGDKTPNTFYGSVDYLINELLKKYKKNQIVFILPLYRLGENNPYGEGYRSKPTLSLQGYRDIIKEVTSVYGIECLDLKDEMGDPEKVDLYEDGLHPNNKGHQKLAELIVNYVKNREK